MELKSQKCGYLDIKIKIKMENCKDGNHRVYRLCEMKKTEKTKEKNGMSLWV